jgi:hypothetical protein
MSGELKQKPDDTAHNEEVMLHSAQYQTTIVASTSGNDLG